MGNRNLLTCIPENVIPKEESISKEQLTDYFKNIEAKINRYIDALQDNELSEMPEGCTMSRFRLVLGQIRHWHMGLIYGFLVEDTGKWPYVLNMLGKYPDEPMP